MNNPEYLKTEVLVIGSGIAGGTAALELAQKGVDVTLLTKSADPKESNSNYAQGGIIYEGENDSPELLAQDIKQAGSNINNERAVEILSREGPELVRRILIDGLKVPFNSGKEGPELVLEGGHGMPRIIHAADTTGRSIMQSMEKAFGYEPKIKIMTGFTAVDLLTPAHHSANRQVVYEKLSCSGAYALDQKSGRILTILAKKTILATGGLGQIFLYSTNPVGARGDGIAMAHRAGARVVNLEFVQFHPTAFFHPQSPRFLITEAARGEGGRLVNTRGEYFMDKYKKDYGEDNLKPDLLPRDFVSRSIYKEMLETGSQNVFLDLKSFIPRAKILEHFPNIRQTLNKFGIDITRDLIPVVPAAHYSCGGVWVDEWGKTSVEGLYAVGEVACTGLHGANRLASTSLLEGLVWGSRSAQDILRTLENPIASFTDQIPAWDYFGNEEGDPALIAQDIDSIKNIMWNYVGLVRTKPRLERALRQLMHLETEINQFYHRAKPTDALLGLRNAAKTALLVAQAAWENKQSIGCHYRES